LVVLLVVDPQVLRAIIAVTVLVFTVLIWRQVHIGGEGRAWDTVVGALSGVLNTSTSMSGPPVVLHLQSQGTKQGSFRASLAAYFLVGSSIAVVLLALSGQVGRDNLVHVLAGIPGIALGVWSGNKVFRRLNGQRFRGVVIAVLFVSGAVALATAVV
jgi:uncharacterized membrane protein YfcA